MRELNSADIDRASRFGAYAACALAALACASLLVKLLWLLVPRGNDAPPVVTVAAPVATTAAVALSKWHLFGNAGPSVNDLARSAPATQLQLTLFGTVADADPKQGLAVVGDPSTGEHAYRVGDTLPGGAILDAVYPDRIVLMHEGVQETLALKLAQPAAAQPGAVSPSAASPGGSRPPRPADANAGTVSPVFTPPIGNIDLSKVQQQYNADPAAIARQVNAQPVFENGRMTGVRLNGGPDATLIAQLGLQPNDIVTSINNVPLDSPGRVQQVIDSVQKSSRVTVTINRDGKPTTLSVNVK
jgi:general secretion pathway protein C